MRKPVEFVNFPITFEDARRLGRYRAVCKYIVDGDTYDAYADLGLYQYWYGPIRIADYNAAELIGAEWEAGRRAKAALADLILGKPILIQTFPTEKKTFERFAAHTYYLNGAGIWQNVALVLTERLATPPRI